MKKPLVESYRGKTFTTSPLVARKIGVEHDKFMRAAKRIIDKLSTTNCRAKTGQENHLWWEFYEDTYRGKTFKALKMNREFFLLVIMRFETKKAFEWQVKFVAAFFDMEKALLVRDANRDNQLWLGMRDTGKSARLTMTEAVKDLVDYATAQGSKSADRYYLLITKATYTALGFSYSKHPNLRETLDAEALSVLVAAEYMLRRNLWRYMAAEAHYKAIYIDLKRDLEAFAEASGIKAPSHG